MVDSIWASIKTDWHGQARCKDDDGYAFFPKNEDDLKLERVKILFCNNCPVRAKCLNSALINGDTGFWGGTSTEMRSAMKRTRYRAKCPVCKSKSVLDVAGDDDGLSSYQVCLACAASWRTGPPLHLTPSEVPVEDVPA